MARKEILICDNCKQEHNELTKPVRRHYVNIEYCCFDLCEECYNKISKIDEKANKKIENAKKQYKVELKKEAEEIYKMMFPREYENKEVEK